MNEQRTLHLGDGKTLTLPENDYLRVRQLATVEGLTVEEWFGRHWGEAAVRLEAGERPGE